MTSCLLQLPAASLTRPLRSPLLALALTVWLALAPAAHAQEAQVEQQVMLGQQALQLNGSGTRRKAMFQVYTAALYVHQPARDLQQVVAQNGPKRLQVQMLRDIDANELGKLFTQGIERNTEREQFVRLVPGILHISELFARQKRLKKGDHFSVDWVPEAGLSIRINDQLPAPPINDPEFFAALLSIWLGPQPADEHLKAALLGAGNHAVQ